MATNHHINAFDQLFFRQALPCPDGYPELLIHPDPDHLSRALRGVYNSSEINKLTKHIWPSAIFLGLAQHNQSPPRFVLEKLWRVYTFLDHNCLFQTYRRGYNPRHDPLPVCISLLNQNPLLHELAEKAWKKRGKSEFVHQYLLERKEQSGSRREQENIIFSSVFHLLECGEYSDEELPAIAAYAWLEARLFDDYSILEEALRMEPHLKRHLGTVEIH